MPGILENLREMPSAAYASSGARLVSTTGRVLPLRTVTLTADAAGGVARTLVRQLFVNDAATPLDVTYQFPLPADGAVAGYTVQAGPRTLKGRVERREDARMQFDAARLEGRTAGLVEQQRANVFTQRLGNLPAFTEVLVELTIDHPLSWLPEGGWEWRFPTVVAPRYLGAPGTVADAEAVTVDLVDGTTNPTASVTLTIADDLQAPPTSSTHGLVVKGGTVSVDGPASLDRDVVVRWLAQSRSPGVSLRTARLTTASADGDDAAYGLLTVIPPAGPPKTLARDLVLLLDVSGSMMGAPLRRLKSVVTTLVESLDDRDRLEMIAFASEPTRYARGPVQATPAERMRAADWVDGLTAGGGTELISAIAEALQPLRRDATRQVVVITDGLIGFESAAIRAIRTDLPAGSRLHTVGIGSASNRAFLMPAARGGRGIEVHVDLNEPVRPAAARILAATRQPVVVDVSIEGTALVDDAPLLPDLLAGSPVLASLRLRAGGGTLTLRGRTADGRWEERISVGETPAGTGSNAITALWARDAIEELELDLACGGTKVTIDSRIEAIALAHSVSSRLTSWIAVSETRDVDPRDPVRVERIPQALPYGMSIDGLVTGDTAAMLLTGTVMGFPMGLLEGARPPRSRARRRKLTLNDRPVEAVPLAPLGNLLGDLIDFLASLLHRRKKIEGLSIALAGRILKTPGRPTTTIECQLTSDLEWRPTSTAVLAGRMVGIVERGTTRPGTIPAGSLLRIEVAASPEEVASAAMVELGSGDCLIAISLAARQGA
jgi:Ca-activated chloride channel family protein